MHEFTLAAELIDAACGEAQRVGARRIQRLRCRVGVLRQVDEWLLREAFGIARLTTPCESAELEIQIVSMRAICAQCEESFAVQNWDWRCPRCGGDGSAPSGGDELELVSIDVDLDDIDAPSVHGQAPRLCAAAAADAGDRP